MNNAERQARWRQRRDARIAERIAELEHENATLKAAARPTGALHNRRIAELEAEVATLKADHQRVTTEYWTLHAAFDDALGRRLGTAAQHKILLAAVHPDRVVEPALKRKYQELFQIVETWAPFFKQPPKRPPPGKFPSTVEELVAARRDVKEANRSRAKKAADTRAANKRGRTALG